MRVPTYTRRTARTADTGATTFSVRASPRALSADMRAAGQAVSMVEDAAISWYEEEQRLLRNEELAEKEAQLETQIEGVVTDQMTRSPQQVLKSGTDADGNASFSFYDQGKQILERLLLETDDKRVRSALQTRGIDYLNRRQISVNQNARTRLVDQHVATRLRRADTLTDYMVRGNGADRAAATLELFGGTDATGNPVPSIFQNMATDGLKKGTAALRYEKEYRGKVDKRIKVADNARLTNNINTLVIDAGNRSSPLDQRLGAIKNFNAEITAAVQKGTLNEQEALDIIGKAADDTIRGIAQALFAEADDASAVALQMIEGDPMELDPILGALLGRMDPSERQTILEDLGKFASSIDTSRREKAEAEDANAEAANNFMYDQIINVDTSDPEALTQAITDHQFLISQNFYDTPAKRQAAEKMLGLASPGGDQSDRTVLADLNRLDAANSLTIEAVTELSYGLNPGDFKNFLTRAVAESKEGLTVAKNLIATQLRYNEFKDTVGAAGDAADLMFNRSMSELLEWSTTPKAEGGGAGATYAETIAKARSINVANNAEYLELMQDAALELLTSQQQFMPGFVVDPAAPVQSAKEYLKQPDVMAKLATSLVLQGIARELKEYERLGLK